MRLADRHRLTLLLFGLLAAWVFWLRWPSFARPAWNVDEGIHATIARTILDGGVMYRDAVDLRTPLTYYLMAGFFGIVGANNMWAVHFLLAGMITVTALGIFLLGRRWRGPAAGVWAALLFCACTVNLLYIGDSYSLSTEWFVILFTTWSTWWVWRTWEQDSFWPAALGGAGFAAAFLCKQPGLLDFGAPLAAVVYAAATGQLRAGVAARRIGGLVTGFTGLTALVLAYFWAHGALDDLYYYAWSYTLVYYGPETSLGDRVAAAGEALRMIWRYYPVFGAALAAAVFGLLARLTPWRSTAEKRQTNPAALHLLAWALLAWAGAASAGRVYGHYFLQFLPAFTLLAGWLLADCHTWWRSSRNRFVRLAAGAVLAAAAWTVIAGPLRGPRPAVLGPEAGMAEAAYIRAHSRPEDKIFVWGFSPDFYLYADRRSASRFVYSSFVTGLIPWTNIQPGRDTSYAISPGALETLLADLAANRPEYIVDTSLGDYRHFLKYPIARFPRLAEYIADNYLEIEPTRFRPAGFRVLLRKNASHGQSSLRKDADSGGPTVYPIVRGPATADPVPVEYQVRFDDPKSRLQRLELLIDGGPADSLSFDPVPAMTVNFVAHFERLGHGWHQLAARATLAGGETRTGVALAVESAPESLPPEKRAAFALSMMGRPVPPDRVVAPFGAEVLHEAGALIFFAHAPSVISYPVAPGSARLGGRFGFRPGAYAASNPGPTDGAEFIITWINPAGRRTELLRRWLRPVEEPADRGGQPFNVVVPARDTGGRLELAITNGPGGSSASDWTYWSDLLLSTSH